MEEKLEMLGEFLKANNITIVKTAGCNNKLCISIENRLESISEVLFMDVEFEEEITGDDIENMRYVIL